MATATKTSTRTSTGAFTATITRLLAVRIDETAGAVAQATLTQTTSGEVVATIDLAANGATGFACDEFSSTGFTLTVDSGAVTCTIKGLAF